MICFVFDVHFRSLLIITPNKFNSSTISICLQVESYHLYICLGSARLVVTFSPIDLQIWFGSYTAQFIRIKKRNIPSFVPWVLHVILYITFSRML